MDIQWDSGASLMRVRSFRTAEDDEEIVARGTLRELVGAVLEMDPAAQRGLLLRVAGADWAEEYDLAEIRELAARPEYTGATGAWDTADLASDDDRAEVRDETPVARGPSGTPAHPREATETL